MFDPDRFTQPVDPVGAFSKAQSFLVWTCYRHLQGDNYFVAEDVTTGRRQFFSTADELQTWVEAQPVSDRARRLGSNVWRPAGRI